MSIRIGYSPHVGRALGPSSWCRALPLLVIAILALLLSPRSMDGQSGVTVFRPKPSTIAARCVGEPRRTDPVVEEVRAALVLAETRPEDARARLRRIRDSLRGPGEGELPDVAARYRVAAALAGLADVEGGATRMKVARELWARVDTVLALEPDHAGALHLRGRLHAAVLRMDGVKRFLATRVMGAGELGAASWDEARAALEASEAADPCQADHHYELAKLYRDLGDVDAAAREVGHVFALPVRGSYDRFVVAKARALLPSAREASTGHGR